MIKNLERIKMNNLLEQLHECKKITCTKLIPFEENGEFFVRWEGKFRDEETGTPMQLIIPKISMNMLSIDRNSSILKKVAVATFEIKVENQLEADSILFTIQVDNKEDE